MLSVTCCIEGEFFFLLGKVSHLDNRGRRVDLGIGSPRTGNGLRYWASCRVSATLISICIVDLGIIGTYYSTSVEVV